MIQVYLLSVVYGALEAVLLLSEALKANWGAASGLRMRISRDRRWLDAFALSGLVLSILLLLFPSEPGPVVLGDLFYALWLSYVAVFLALRYSGKRQQSPKWIRRTGYASALFTLLHFLFPGLILI